MITLYAYNMIHFSFEQTVSNIGCRFELLLMFPFEFMKWKNIFFYIIKIGSFGSNFSNLSWFFVVKNIHFVCRLCASIFSDIFDILPISIYAVEKVYFLKCIKIDSFDKFIKSKLLLKHSIQRHKWPNPDVVNKA